MQISDNEDNSQEQPIKQEVAEKRKKDKKKKSKREDDDLCANLTNE